MGRSRNQPTKAHFCVPLSTHNGWFQIAIAMSPETPLHHRTITNGLPSDHIPKRSTMEPNVLNIVLGTLLVKPWYPSFYPEELVGRTADRLYVCQWCFKYSKELMPFLGHVVRQSRSNNCSISCWSVRARKPALSKTPHHPGRLYTPKTAIQSTKSMVKSTKYPILNPRPSVLRA